MGKLTEQQKFEEGVERNLKIAATLWWNLSGMSMWSAAINNWNYRQKQARAYRKFMKK